MHLGADREIEQDDDHRHADPVVQPTFQVEGLAGGGGHLRIGNDGRAERGVGGRQQGSQQGDFQHLQPGKHSETDEEAKQDGQGQADQQQPLRQAHDAAHDAEIGMRRVGEQHHRERDLGQDLEIGRGERKLQHTEAGRAEHQPRPGEQNRPAQPGSPHAPGRRAVDQHDGGKDGEVFIHFGCQTPRSAGARLPLVSGPSDPWCTATKDLAGAGQDANAAL